MTVASKKKTTKKDVIVEKKAEKEVIQVKKTQDAKKEVKQISNTQRCADLIIQFARDAKYTRQEIVASVADAISALSIVTVKTMLSDLQNAKYAKRYSSRTIAVDKTTKLVTIASEIKQ